MPDFCTRMCQFKRQYSPSQTDYPASPAPDNIVQKDFRKSILSWLRTEILLVLDVRSTLRSFFIFVFRHPDFFIGLLLLP